MVAEYSTKDKYQVFTIDLQNGLTDRELDTMIPETNFLTTFFVNTTTGESINTGKINISFVSSKNYPLTFLNGSKYKASFQKIYLNAQPQPNVSVRIFTSIDCFYEKETPVTNAVLVQPISVVNSSISYSLSGMSGSLNNSTVTQTLYKDTSSIIVANTANSGALYVGGDNFDMSNYSSFAMKIEAGEKLSINFNPLAKTGYKIRLASPDAVTYTILANYVQ